MSERVNWNSISNEALLAEIGRRELDLRSGIGEAAVVGSQSDNLEQEPMPSPASLFALQPELTLEKGEKITRSTGFIFLLSSGYIASYSFINGERNVQYIYAPDEIFPLQNASRVVSEQDIVYRALNIATYKAMPKVEFDGLMQSDSGVARVVVKQMEERLAFLTERIDVLQQRKAYGQVAYQLTILAVRFGKCSEGVWSISLPLGHQEIADLLGLTRETTSRTISLLKRQGLVSYNKWHQLVIPNLEALRGVI